MSCVPAHVVCREHNHPLPSPTTPYRTASHDAIPLRVPLRARSADSNTSRKSIRKLINYLAAAIESNLSDEARQALKKKWSDGVNKSALVYVAHGLNTLPSTVQFIDDEPRDFAVAHRPKVNKLTLAGYLLSWVRFITLSAYYGES